MSRENIKEKFFPSVIKAVILSLVITLSAILIFALILKFSNLTNTAVKIVNQFIKVVAIFIGCFFSLRGDKGLIKGAVSGALFAFLAYLLLGLICGNMPFNVGILLEILFGTAIGAISGILTVNVRN